MAIFADALAPYGYTEINLADRMQGSSARHLLGTDYAGRDLLSRLLQAARLALVVGMAATTVNVVVAVLIGGTSGFFGGKFDLAVQRLWTGNASSRGSAPAEVSAMRPLLIYSCVKRFGVPGGGA